MNLCQYNWLPFLRRGIVVLCMALLPCIGQAEESITNSKDPYESYNRFMFSINDTVDSYTLKPIAQGYKKILPTFMQEGITNFLHNMGDVGNLVNNTLQGKPHGAATDLSRMLLNTTLGGLGFFDVATKMGLERSDEDVGQTLGVWGVPNGPYIVLPFFGPSTGRDMVGLVGDGYLLPEVYLDDVRVRNSLLVLGLINLRARLLLDEKLVTGDRYSFIRDVYLQNREFRTKDGQVEDDF